MKKTLQKLGRAFNPNRESSRSRQPPPAQDRDHASVSAVYLPSDSNVISGPQAPQVDDAQSIVAIQPAEFGITPCTTPPDPDPISSTTPSKHHLPPSTSGVMPLAPTESTLLPQTFHYSQIHELSIFNNNETTTNNLGGIVFNYNPVITKVYLTKEEKNVVRTIWTALGDQFVPSAMHDVVSDSAGCMPGTRLNVLSKFLKWAKDDPMRLFWLSGLAGTGKTSIAVTLSRMLQDEPKVLFGGAFFCSRTTNIVGMTDARCILPTIAAALAELSPAFATALATELETDPRAALKPISSQIVSLLQNPLSSLATSVRPIVFIIDGLDECSSVDVVEQLLHALSALTCVAKVKFIVTSRPDMHINTSFSHINPDAVLRLHTIDAAEVKEDIRLYINDRFSKQPRAKEWYTESDATSLAISADGLFIFASTVIAYVLDRPSASPDYRRSRLQNVISAMKNSRVATRPLDIMYSFVLYQASASDTVEPQELEATRQVLACILTARVPLSITALSEILEQEPDTLQTSLLLLTALVHIPYDVEEPTLRTVHASFGDYIFERAPNNLRITAGLGHETLARGCLQVMRQRLHFNVSQSCSSHEPNSRNKPNSITLSLEYACLQWVYHLADLQRPQMLDSEIIDNFCPNFLFWLEVMSILRQIPRSTAMLFIAIAKVKSTELRRFLSDGSAFVTSSQKAIERSAPHIYLSALPLVPEQSLIHKRFVPFCTGLVSIDVFGIDRSIGSTSVIITGHTDVVTAVRYAPDGRLISCSRDGTVHIWDTHTGEEIVAFVCSGHGSVECVDVTLGGASIVAGTADGAVFIWNLQAPQQAPRTLLGHHDMVSSVTFSPCGHMIASGATSGELGLWSAETAKEISVISKDSHSVCAVSFSPDGETLASGSLNQVGFWNGRTGQPATVPALHNDIDVWSLAFTSDGKILAVGLIYAGIVLWEMSTMTKIATLGTNTNEIASLQFSRDGTSLLCCSWENDFRLYDLHQDAINSSPAVFAGHSGLVNCARFSPDGLHIASASDDHTIRIWNVGDGKPEAQTSHAHKDPVRSVHVSADGTLIVSSHWRSVHVWDALTGAHKLSSFMSDSHQVFSVAMFPPARFMQNPQWDHTLQLLDVRTGKEIGGPPRNHTSDILAVMVQSDKHFGSPMGNSVNIWDIAAQQPSSSILPRCQGNVRSVTFSPDGRLVSARDDEKYIYVWDSNTGKPVCAPFQNSKRYEWSSAMAISHSGALIACPRDDKIVDVLDIGTGNRIITLEGHSETVHSIAFAPDDLRIVTGSSDYTVRLWDAATGAPLAVLHGHGSALSSVTFTPDGLSIISGSYDLTIRVWDVENALARSSNISLDPATALKSDGFDDGWLLGPKGELLLWLPKEYRGYIKGPNCRVYIADRRVSIITPETRHHGTNWTACWCGHPST